MRHALHLLRGHHQAVLVRVLGEEEQGLGVFRRDDGKIMIDSIGKLSDFTDFHDFHSVFFQDLMGFINLPVILDVKIH